MRRAEAAQVRGRRRHLRERVAVDDCLHLRLRTHITVLQASGEPPIVRQGAQKRDLLTRLHFGAFHDVGGTARSIDDCTIEITDFTYDGTGIDVRLYGDLDGKNPFRTTATLTTTRAARRVAVARCTACGLAHASPCRQFV